METLKNILTFPVKILIFTFGLLMLYLGVMGLLANRSVWISIEGRVISSVETSDYDSTLVEYENTYEYQVGAEKYTGKYKYYRAVPIGQKITIYYDPANPTNSARSQEEFGWQSFWEGVFGLGCVIWVIRDAIMGIRGKTETPIMDEE